MRSGGKKCCFKLTLSSGRMEPGEGKMIIPGSLLFFSEGLLFVLPQ